MEDIHTEYIARLRTDLRFLRFRCDETIHYIGDGRRR